MFVFIVAEDTCPSARQCRVLVVRKARRQIIVLSLLSQTLWERFLPSSKYFVRRVPERGVQAHSRLTASSHSGDTSCNDSFLVFACNNTDLYVNIYIAIIAKGVTVNCGDQPWQWVLWLLSQPNLFPFVLSRHTRASALPQMHELPFQNEYFFSERARILSITRIFPLRYLRKASYSIFFCFSSCFLIRRMCAFF